MSYAERGAKALDYSPCRYGSSRLVFRGPRADLDGDYIAFLGGAETYGKYVVNPFPGRVEDMLDVTCLNLGFVQSGVDAYLYDPSVMGLLSGARAVVVQLFGAQNLSNRFYRVHPRRNDRFIQASPRLNTLFPALDFTDYHFNKHMLHALKARDEALFQMVVDEVQTAWLARMKQLVRAIPVPVILLWLHNRADYGLGPEPLFVTPEMVQDLSGHAAAVLDISVSPAGADLDGMHFEAMEIEAATRLPGPEAHQMIAGRVAALVQGVLDEKRPA